MRRLRSFDPAAVDAEVDLIRSLGIAALRARWRLMFGGSPPAGLSAKSNASLSFLASSYGPRRRRQEASVCSQKLSVDFVAARTRKVSGREAFRKGGTI